MRVQIQMSEYVKDFLDEIYGTEELQGSGDNSDVPADIVELITNAQHENDVIDGPKLTRSDVKLIIAAHKTDPDSEGNIYVRAPRPRKKSPFSEEGREETREIMKEELRGELTAEITENVVAAMEKKAAKSKGGRPAGSKNKPKAEPTAKTETAE